MMRFPSSRSCILAASRGRRRVGRGQARSVQRATGGVGVIAPGYSAAGSTGRLSVRAGSGVMEVGVLDGDVVCGFGATF